MKRKTIDYVLTSVKQIIIISRIKFNLSTIIFPKLHPFTAMYIYHIQHNKNDFTTVSVRFFPGESLKNKRKNVVSLFELCANKNGKCISLDMPDSRPEITAVYTFFFGRLWQWKMETGRKKYLTQNSE